VNPRQPRAGRAAGTVGADGRGPGLCRVRVPPVARRPEACENWDAVVRHVADSQPDLVLHLGDLALDGTGDDLAAARLPSTGSPVPWWAVPGNHDIGDNPWDGLPAGITVEAVRRERWLDAIGPDRSSVTLDGWRLVAVDAQLFGSGLEAETQQWSWLEEQFASAHGGAGRACDPQAGDCSGGRTRRVTGAPVRPRGGAGSAS
jgi:3',5'-cyclic AMP phosphodiesterase CpdA